MRTLRIASLAFVIVFLLHLASHVAAPHSCSEEVSLAAWWPGHGAESLLCSLRAAWSWLVRRFARC